MQEMYFGYLVLAAGFATAALLVAETKGIKNLPDSLRTAKEVKASETVEFCKANPLYYALRIVIMLGYYISLACVGFTLQGSREGYLLFSLAWSGISYFDGPLILPKPAIPFYEASLLLNGAVLALSFCSPLASLF